MIAELEARNLREDTLIVYITDNGWEIGQAFFGDLGHGKGSLFDLGSRTPMVFNWPGRIESGVVRDDLVTFEDLFATLIDFAGGEPLPDRDGRISYPPFRPASPLAATST